MIYKLASCREVIIISISSMTLLLSSILGLALVYSKKDDFFHTSTGWYYIIVYTCTCYNYYDYS